jgi:hypothetical protein
VSPTKSTLTVPKGFGLDDFTKLLRSDVFDVYVLGKVLVIITPSPFYLTGKCFPDFLDFIWSHRSISLL